ELAAYSHTGQRLRHLLRRPDRNPGKPAPVLRPVLHYEAVAGQEKSAPRWGSALFCVSRDCDKMDVLLDLVDHEHQIQVVAVNGVVHVVASFHSAALIDGYRVDGHAIALILH